MSPTPRILTTREVDSVTTPRGDGPLRFMYVGNRYSSLRFVLNIPFTPHLINILNLFHLSCCARQVAAAVYCAYECRRRHYGVRCSPLFWYIGSTLAEAAGATARRHPKRRASGGRRSYAGSGSSAVLRATACGWREMGATERQ